MKPLRVALLLGIAAVVFGRAIPSLLLMGQEPSPKTAGATTPETVPHTDGGMGVAASQMHSMQEGLQEYRKENFRAAAQKFEAAAAIQGAAMQTAHTYAWLARTYLHLHRVPEAEAAARKATETDKELANAQTALAEVYFREGKLAEASELLI